MSRRIALTGGIACGKSLVAKYLRTLGVETIDADDIVHEILPDPEERKRIAAEVFADPEKRKVLEARIHPIVKERIEEFFDSPIRRFVDCIDSLGHLDLDADNAQMAEVVAQSCHTCGRVCLKRVEKDGLLRFDAIETIASTGFATASAQCSNAIANRRIEKTKNSPNAIANRRIEKTKNSPNAIANRRIEKSKNIKLAIIPLLFETHWDTEYDIICAVISSRETQVERMMATRGYTREEAEARLAAQMPVTEKAAKSHYVIQNNASAEALFNEVKKFVHWLTV